VKTATTIFKAILPDDSGLGYIKIKGIGSCKRSKILVVQQWPEAVDRADRVKAIEFYDVEPAAIRELRKALQTREAELVVAGYLEEE
jgi:hypothetical protein